MAHRRLVFAGTLATALTLRYLWPHSVAGADQLVAKVEPKRDPTVLREVLRQVRAVEAVTDEDDDAGTIVAEDDEPDDAPQAPQPGLDADGLTEDERFESDVAVVEDRLRPTRGALMGVAKDARTGEALAGVTVIVRNRFLEGSQAAITDERGAYTITDLPAGEYLVTFYYLESTIERSGLLVAEGKTTPAFQTIDTQQNYVPLPPPRVDLDYEFSGEIYINDEPPVIDPTSTVQGITIDTDYIKNIPVPGRTFEGVIGVSAGSQEDNMGVSFSGTTSLENTYYIDGDLIEDIEVIE